MVLLPLYALFVWFLCLRFRRRWIGFVCAIAGAASVLLVIPVAGRVLRFLGSNEEPRVFALLIYGEALIVLLVGLYVAMLPRRDRRNRCPYCDYDLSGHSAEQPPVCPECGVPFDGYLSKRKHYVNAEEVREALAARQEAIRYEFSDPERAAEITRRISAIVSRDATPEPGRSPSDGDAGGRAT